MVTITTFASLIAAGCGPERTPPPPAVVAAGDIVDCVRADDEATAGLVDRIEGTVLTLGDHAYPDGSAEKFAECFVPVKGEFFGDSGVARCH